MAYAIALSQTGPRLSNRQLAIGVPYMAEWIVMNGRFISSHGAAVISLLASLLVLFAAPNGDARLSDSSTGGIRYGRTGSGYLYMNGGSYLHEQNAMERRSAPYNLRLILVPSPATALPKLQVLIANNVTESMEKIPLSGPWVYFQLPPGAYTIGARIGDKFFLLRNVTVQETGRQTHIFRDNLFRTITNPVGGAAR